MDIFSEIRRLPNFGYVFEGDDGKLHIVVLGGFACKKIEGDYPFYRKIEQVNYDMQKIYTKDFLEDEDKEYLAHLKQKMQSLCESRKDGTYTLEQQRAYIDALSNDEKQQIELQVRMYKDCRFFYRDYIKK